MGPDAECLFLARLIKEKHPEITTSDIDIAYTIQGWAEQVEREKAANDG